MRLIDADYLKTWFGEKDLYTYDYIIGTIDDAPTVKPEAKLLAEVKFSKEKLQELVDKTAEKIRKEMAQPEQHWILCSERLPEEHESIWAKAKGTDRWSEAMWEKQSDEVIVTELFKDGTTRTDTACTHDGEWYEKAKIVKRKIIAWMPLPEPWKENDHGSNYTGD